MKKEALKTHALVFVFVFVL